MNFIKAKYLQDSETNCFGQVTCRNEIDCKILLKAITSINYTDDPEVLLCRIGNIPYIVTREELRIGGIDVNFFFPYDRS